MTDPGNLEGLTLEELQELERLLLLLEMAENAPQKPTAQEEKPRANAESKPEPKPQPKPQPRQPEPQQDFVNELCGPGSDKPSGRKPGKWGFMG